MFLNKKKISSRLKVICPNWKFLRTEKKDKFKIQVTGIYHVLFSAVFIFTKAENFLKQTLKRTTTP